MVISMSFTAMIVMCHEPTPDLRLVVPLMRAGGGAPGSGAREVEPASKRLVSPPEACAIWASACADVPTWFVLFSVSPVTIQNVGLARIAR